MPQRIIVLLVLAAAVIAGFWATQRSRAPATVEWQGYAEADFVKVGPTQQGLITAVHVMRGDQVVTGQPLFEQDDIAERAGVEQAKRLFLQAQNQLENLQAPAKPTEIAAAEANLRDAEAARDRVNGDLQRNQALLKTGAATVQIVDQEQADLRSATAKIAVVQAQLDQAKAPLGRPDEIEAQLAAVEAARAALTQTEWRLDQRSARSPAAGIVADVLARPGETLAAGAPVVSLLPPFNVFVRFFVPEPGVAQVRVGETVALLCDNCPAGMAGTVSFIAPQAEYTPPFIYSESTRTKFVFLAEARPHLGEGARLNPGEPVTVRPIAMRP